MIIEQHYDDEVLISMLEQSSESGVRDPHIASCTTCTSALDSIRQVTGALHDETVWDRRELAEESRPTTRETLRSFASAAAGEDGAAEPWVKSLVARPSSEWRSMVEQNPQWRTAGFVRGLIAAVDAINFTSPTDAVELTKITVEVAEGLAGTSDRLAKLRASAWREHAYALYYVGSYADSLAALDRCDKLLTACRVSEYDAARAQLVRASAYSATERLDEAIVLARRARKTFSAFGDLRRALVADITEAAILMDARRYSDSLAIHFRIMSDATADETSRACSIHNAAICCRELSHLTQAKLLFAQAIAAYERLGLTSFRAKARWNFARILLAAGDYNAAVALFGEVRADFEELGIAHGVALVCVDSAEALLLAGRPQEVSSLCHAAMQYFRTADLAYTRGALTALAHLREASELKALTVRDVNDVRAFFEILPKQPELLFARPA